MFDINKICLASNQTLRQAMIAINEAACGIALVVDSERRLQFTITDGDLRRAILHGLSPELTLACWARECPEKGNRLPTMAPAGSQPHDLVARMRAEGILQIPLIDEAGAVVELAVLSELLPLGDAGLEALVMAGGEGQRLRPLTSNTPKPLLPVGGRPIVQRTIERLRDAGIRRVTIATHYKSDQFVNHFGDGSDLGIAIEYVCEDQPLGTAGALGLARPWSSPLLVINGDLMTEINYQRLLEFHREQDAVATIGVRQCDFQVPYGVVETQGPVVHSIREKPVYQFLANAGIYLLAPEVYFYVGRRERLDMTELLARLLVARKSVASFPIAEYWIDIGRHEDYARAQQDVEEGLVGL